jgi:hypothetical protein
MAGQRLGIRTPSYPDNDRQNLFGIGSSNQTGAVNGTPVTAFESLMIGRDLHGRLLLH